ncbi:MAG: hypothetical protein ABSH28_24040, partial [Acidobacteriota bacterium]
VLALTAADSLLGFAINFLDLGIGLAAEAGLIWLLRRNACGYLVAFAWTGAIPLLQSLLRHPAYRMDAGVFAAMLLAATTALVLWWRSESQQERAFLSSSERKSAST